MLGAEMAGHAHPREALLHRHQAPGRFHRGRDLRQHLDCLDREGAHRGLPRQHHAIGAVENRVRDVGGLRPRRQPVGGHGFEHLGGGDHRLRAQVGAPHDVLLDDRDALDRHLHAQVAARDHDTVRLRQDLVEPVERPRPLDLGDHERVVPECQRRLAHGAQVGRALDE